MSGYLTRVRNGQATDEPVVQNSNGTLVPLPIDLGPETDQVYLILFGSGIGKTGTVSTVTASIGGININPSYTGAQGTWSGLDQFNIPMPRTLIGKGKVNVTITVNSKVSNTVNVTFK